WTGAEEHGRRAIAAAVSFLGRLSLSPGTLSAFRMGHGDRGGVAILPADAGHPVDGTEGHVAHSTDGPPGIALVDRPAIAVLAEMFATVNDRRPRAAALWGPAGSGLDTAVLLLARSARMHGFVAIDSRLLDGPRDLVAERSLFIIERRPGRTLAPWLHALLRSARPHVCLFV